jgi:hypothetical protein
VGPIYGWEDLLGGWVSKRKKRKAAPGLRLPPAKKRATEEVSAADLQEVCDSDADDEDDLVTDESESGVGQPLADETQSQEDQQGPKESQGDERRQAAKAAPQDEPLAKDTALSTLAPSAGPAADIACEVRVSTAATDSMRGQVVSSIEGPQASVDAPSVPVVRSSQDSTSSQSGSDSQNPVARIEKDAKAALHQIEVATGVSVSPKHRGLMIDRSLALGGRDALESFRQACSCWRKDYASQASLGLAAVPGSQEWHPALNRFSRAYHDTKDTTRRRAALDLLHRINLAHLHDVYLETLQALTGHSLEPNALRVTRRSRAQDVFGEDDCDTVKNEMFWACYPTHIGKPRSSVTGLDRTFRGILTNAKKWHDLREEFSTGLLALVPPGANTWYERLPLGDVPVYFTLVRAINPAAVLMGEKISDRVLSCGRGEAPPELLLRLEYLETVDEIPSQANPLKLLEEVNISGITGVPASRAVTVPAGVDENNAAALNAVFSSLEGLSARENDEYQLPPGFFDGVDLGGP